MLLHRKRMWLLRHRPTRREPSSWRLSARSLQKDHFHVKVAKAVPRKLFETKENRFSGNGSQACLGSLHATGVGVTVIFRHRGSRFRSPPPWTAPPLPSARGGRRFAISPPLELLVHPTSPAADWMDSPSSTFPSDGKRVLLEFAQMPTSCCIRTPHSREPPICLGFRVIANVDPHDAISDFNTALKAARTRSTWDEEDAKSVFIQALDRTFYQPAVSRLLLHD
ncbi:hypothetical protein CYMTET_51711 [Cymbomonas tetramitiformis]|uniref:Uncharacterized protein n=1 Tax=Cymbomonas tetramitiformis TaxID=36881 RepID=A0AAE0ESD9_9CHLO|nr:hypothetical protein CYMTET_51711 [Cymbomonas tetramitiformis]